MDLADVVGGSQEEKFAKQAPVGSFVRLASSLSVVGVFAGSVDSEPEAIDCVLVA